MGEGLDRSEVRLGRRERKKAATRDALADAALQLFLERGFDRVSVKDIAEAADVSISTLFKHFGSKEALVFDEEADREAALVAAVAGRGERSVPQALCEHLVQRLGSQTDHPEMGAFLHLIRTTPALSDYGRRMWTRHEAALARAIAQETGASPDDLASVALARFSLEAPNIARAFPDEEAALRQMFDLLDHGWTAQSGRLKV